MAARRPAAPEPITSTLDRFIRVIEPVLPSRLWILSYSARVSQIGQWWSYSVLTKCQLHPDSLGAQRKGRAGPRRHDGGNEGHGDSDHLDHGNDQREDPEGEAQSVDHTEF